MDEKDNPIFEAEMFFIFFGHKEIYIIMMEYVAQLKEFIENEARYCSMDFGCVTPLYVYRMWGGTVPFEEIEQALVYLRANNYGY